MAKFISPSSKIGRAFAFAPSVSGGQEPPSEECDFFLFNSLTGGPNNSLTGGWNTYITGGYGSPVVDITNDGISVRAPWWQDAVAETNNDVDLTDVTSITIVVSSYTNEPWYYYSSFNYPTASGSYDGVAIANPSNYSFNNREIVIPITNGGVGPLRFNVTNSESGATILHSVLINACPPEPLPLVFNIESFGGTEGNESTLVARINSTNPNDGTLVFSLVDAPSGFTINSANGEITADSTVDQGGYTLDFLVEDGVLESPTPGEVSFTILPPPPPYPTGDFMETFFFTGGPQTWNKPEGIISNFVIEASAGSGSRGGAGGQVVATMTNVPESFIVEVGQAGTYGSNRAGGYNGGGSSGGSRGNEGSGAGATDIRFNSSIESRILVAGGGGGGGGGVITASGASGGGLTAGSGNAGQGTPGLGGSQVAGGLAGSNNGGGQSPTDGGLGFGGNGGSGIVAGGGGGGGGYFGGGGGGADDVSGSGDGSGGGGGSSYVDSSYFTNITETPGVQWGHGRVYIYYTIS